MFAAISVHRRLRNPPFTSLILALAGNLLRLPSISAQAEPFTAEFIYDTNKVSFPECHASTIAESGGKFVSAWFGGAREGAKDVKIWTARKENKNWTEPVVAATGTVGGSPEPCWNPVLFQPDKGPLLLFYKMGRSPREWKGFLKVSADHGVSWSEAKALPEGILGPIKNKPIQLATGELLCPSSTEQDGWKIHMEWTPDLGETWTKTEALNDGKEFGAIQPTILFGGGQRLEAIGRTRQKTIFQIWSEDNGKSWGKMKELGLPNPNSGIDAVTLKDKTHLLVYNHTTKGRSPLNVAVSKDGSNWDAALVLEKSAGEYSYPAVIQAADGLVHIVYTWNRRCIKHVVVNAADLKPKPIIDGKWPE
jgi:predicted neuraminidase